MRPFFGVKVMMLAVVGAPFLGLVIFFVIRPIPVEIPAEITYLEAGLKFHQQGQLDLAVAAYDLATEIDQANIKAFLKRGDIYFAKGDMGHALVDYNTAISLRSLLVSGLGSRKNTDVVQIVSKAYMGKALVYALQGRDLEAQRIATQAVNFGYDPVLAKMVFEAVLKRR